MFLAILGCFGTRFCPEIPGFFALLDPGFHYTPPYKGGIVEPGVVGAKPQLFSKGSLN